MEEYEVRYLPQEEAVRALQALGQLWPGAGGSRPVVLVALVEQQDQAGRRGKPERPQGQALHQQELERVSLWLGQLGIRPQRRGFRYLRQGVLMLARGESRSVTKEVYPQVGRLWGVDGAQVERAMRSVIRDAWQQGDGQAWEEFFPAGRPSNGVFLYALAERLRLEEGLG